jgi:flagellar FliL protein
VADEDNETEGKKKKPILKIILLVLVVIILLAGTVFGTLFATGFFDEKPAASAEAALEGAEGAAAATQEGKAAAAAAAGAAAVGPDGKPLEPQRVTKESPEFTRFEFTYHEVEREFLVNLTNSRKVMQVQIALMTRYDKRVFENFKKHEFALRSVTLDVMRQVTEADIVTPDFRVKLAQNIREAMNAKLEEFEDFGGIEEIYFTTFVIQ